MDDGAAAAGAGRATPKTHRGKRGRGVRGRRREPAPLYAALDLGTNNCRLLVATPAQGGLRVVDAFSRIVRLGEGLVDTGELSADAMERSISALKVCASKIRRRAVTRTRCIATQACRAAKNGPAFLERVRAETGLTLEPITPQEEARLSVMGCLALIDRSEPCALVVDIGGGSTELSWLDVAELARREAAGQSGPLPIAAWASAPVGVVTLAERFPDGDDPAATYERMKAYAAELLPAPPGAERFEETFAVGGGLIVGSSGTVTSLAGVHLGLPRYERSLVDGAWLTRGETLAACTKLKDLDRAGRALEPCVGADRADVVLAGCAILEAVVDAWPAERLRVADRGLREGMLMSLMYGRKRKRRRNRRRGRAKPEAST